MAIDLAEFHERVYEVRRPTAPLVAQTKLTSTMPLCFIARLIAPLAADVGRCDRHQIVRMIPEGRVTSYGESG